MGSSSEAHIGSVGGHSTSTPTGTFTRPSDSNAYAALDGVTNSTTAASPVTIANAARVDGGSGVVMSARIVKSTNATAASGLRLWLYSVAPASAVNDNAAFSIAASLKATRLGYFDLTTVIVGSDCVEFSGNTGSYQNGMPFKLASGTSLFGIIQTLGAFTPASAEVFDIYLSVLQD